MAIKWNWKLLQNAVVCAVCVHHHRHRHSKITSFHSQKWIINKRYCETENWLLNTIRFDCKNIFFSLLQKFFSYFCCSRSLAGVDASKANGHASIDARHTHPSHTQFRDIDFNFVSFSLLFVFIHRSFIDVVAQFVFCGYFVLSHSSLCASPSAPVGRFNLFIQIDFYSKRIFLFDACTDCGGETWIFVTSNLECTASFSSHFSLQQFLCKNSRFSLASCACFTFPFFRTIVACFTYELQYIWDEVEDVERNCLPFGWTKVDCRRRRRWLLLQEFVESCVPPFRHFSLFHHRFCFFSLLSNRFVRFYFASRTEILAYFSYSKFIQRLCDLQDLLVWPRAHECVRLCVCVCEFECG